MVACADEAAEETDTSDNCYGVERTSAGPLLFTGVSTFSIEEHAGRHNSFSGFGAERDQQVLDWTHFAISSIDSVALTAAAIVASLDGVSPLLITTGTLDFEQSSTHSVVVQLTEGAASLSITLLIGVSDRAGPSYAGDTEFELCPGDPQPLNFPATTVPRLRATDVDGAVLDWTQFKLMDLSQTNMMMPPLGVSVVATSQTNDLPMLVVDRSNADLQAQLADDEYTFMVMYIDPLHDEGASLDITLKVYSSSAPICSNGA